MKYYKEDQIYVIAGIGKCDDLYDDREKFLRIRGHFSETVHLGGRWSAGVFSPIGNNKDLAFDKVRFEEDEKLKDISISQKDHPKIEETQDKKKEDKSWLKHGKN